MSPGEQPAAPDDRAGPRCPAGWAHPAGWVYPPGTMPAAGHLVRLRTGVSDRPFRVLCVTATPDPGVVRLSGYLMLGGGRRRFGEHDVAVARLRRLPEPLWDR